jgi:V/A-type H+/Na+-transporting ATPase subunit G/H
MKAEILSQIKAAEAEAQRMIDEAQTQKEATIEDAKKKSLQIIDAAEQEASKIAGDLNASADAEITAAQQKIHEAGEAEILKIKERAEKKHAEALTFLVEEFKRTHYA